MSKDQINLRRLLTARLASFGVDRIKAHHEVGYLLNRRDREEVVTAVMLHADRARPIDSVRERLNLMSEDV